MLRWRREVSPPLPESLLLLGEILNSDEWKHLTCHDNGNLGVTCIRAADGSVVVVFADQLFLNTLQGVEELHVDGTFKVCPRKPSDIYQLVTIMARVRGEVSHYIIFHTIKIHMA